MFKWLLNVLKSCSLACKRGHLHQEIHCSKFPLVTATPVFHPSKFSSTILLKSETFKLSKKKSSWFWSFSIFYLKLTTPRIICPIKSYLPTFLTLRNWWYDRIIWYTQSEKNILEGALLQKLPDGDWLRNWQETDIDLFHATGLFLHPLNLSENLWYSDASWGWRNKVVVWNGLIMYCFFGTWSSLFNWPC